jgi:hypothetical protein
MKIVVVSDVHGDYLLLNKVININPNCDIYLLLGDSSLEEYAIYPFISVKGNCDYEDYPLEKIITTPAGKIYATHGHYRFINNAYLKNKDPQIKVCLQGHTHIRSFYQNEDIIYANPGSLKIFKGEDIYVESRKTKKK